VGTVSRWRCASIVVAVFLLALATGAVAGTGHRLGGGAHYWRTLDKVDLAEVDESGISWLVSYQLAPGSLVKFEADLEIFPKKFAGTEHPVYGPTALVLVGSTIYGGLGIGTYYYDGELADNPFYLLRAGVDFELLPTLYLDVHANYRWEDWQGLGEAVKDIDTDTITLGAAVRFAF
jgi:hypothetical protein